eukprot:2638042-Pyramimonas_sp.AAC.1
MSRRSQKESDAGKQTTFTLPRAGNRVRARRHTMRSATQRTKLQYTRRAPLQKERRRAIACRLVDIPLLRSHITSNLLALHRRSPVVTCWCWCWCCTDALPDDLRAHFRTISAANMASSCFIFCWSSGEANSTSASCSLSMSENPPALVELVERRGTSPVGAAPSAAERPSKRSAVVQPVPDASLARQSVWASSVRLLSGAASDWMMRWWSRALRRLRRFPVLERRGCRSKGVCANATTENATNVSAGRVTVCRLRRMDLSMII